MPYIEQHRREALNRSLSNLISQMVSPGELNYCITKLCIGYASQYRKCYTTFNTIMGVLNCASKEFYRRFVAPYEDEKITENGDIV